MLPVHRRVAQAGSTAKIVPRPGCKFFVQNALADMNIIIFHGNCILMSHQVPVAQNKNGICDRICEKGPFGAKIGF